MSELKGLLIAMLLFVGFFLPGFLTIGIDTIHNHGFMKVTAEVSDLVKREGGVTSKVNSVVNQLTARGYQIQFQNSNGSPLYGSVGYGDTVVIQYEYKYQGVFQERTLKTQNKVFNMIRN